MAATAPASRSILPNPVAEIRQQADQAHGTMLYVLLLLTLVLSGFGLPIPEEIPLMLAGYKAWHDAASLYVLIPIGLIGVLTADIMLFTAAKRWRGHIFRLRLIRATIKQRHLTMARTQFHKHGMKIVVVARWLPALRSAVCLTAGLTGVGTLHFLLVDAVAACITVPTSIFLGYLAANQIDHLIAGFQWAEHAVLLIVLLCVAAVLGYWFIWGRRRHRRRKLGKPVLSQDDSVSPGQGSCGAADSRSENGLRHQNVGDTHRD